MGVQQDTPWARGETILGVHCARVRRGRQFHSWRCPNFGHCWISCPWVRVLNMRVLGACCSDSRRVLGMAGTCLCVGGGGCPGQHFDFTLLHARPEGKRQKKRALDTPVPVQTVTAAARAPPRSSGMPQVCGSEVMGHNSFAHRPPTRTPPRPSLPRSPATTAGSAGGGGGGDGRECTGRTAGECLHPIRLASEPMSSAGRRGRVQRQRGISGPCRSGVGWWVGTCGATPRLRSLAREPLQGGTSL